MLTAACHIWTLKLSSYFEKPNVIKAEKQTTVMENNDSEGDDHKSRWRWNQTNKDDASSLLRRFFVPESPKVQNQTRTENKEEPQFVLVLTADVNLWWKHRKDEESKEEAAFNWM